MNEIMLVLQPLV